MPPLALALALSAALVHASWNLLLARSRVPRAATAIATVASVTLPLPIVAATWAATPAVIPFAVASSALELAYLALLAAAYAGAELSVVYPLARGLAPVLVLGLGVLVGGAPHAPSAVAGVAMVGAGVILVRGAGAGPSWRDLLPVLAIAGCIAGYTTIDKVGVMHASPLTYYELVMAGPAILYLGAMLGARGPQTVRLELHPSTVIAGLGMFAAYSLVLTALTLAPAASVAAARETSVVLAAIMGGVFLSEPVGPRRLLGAVVVAAGIGAIALG
ncbi:MAG: EamA family transporter [Candidatus Limnocylindrales bacterium]